MLSSSLVLAQSKEKSGRIGVLPLPAIGFSPETRTYVGAVALLTYSPVDTLVRSSNAKLEFNYSQNRQSIFIAEWNLFSPHERWFIKGRLGYSLYPDQYFGIGVNSPKDGKTGFESTRQIAELSAFLKIRPFWFAGPVLRYIRYSDVKALTNARVYPELRDAEIQGLGVALLVDSRNSLLRPESGRYFFTQFVVHQFHERFQADARTYHRLGKATWANRLYLEQVWGSAPFFDLALYGGDAIVRGFFFGRYRAAQLSTLQTECRLEVYRKWGCTFFGGLGSLGQHPADISSLSLKWNTGIGIRFVVDPKEQTHLRLDYAIGSQGNSGFYISFGEAF
jgi:hypothetical protein